MSRPSSSEGSDHARPHFALMQYSEMVNSLFPDFFLLALHRFLCLAFDCIIFWLRTYRIQNEHRDFFSLEYDLDAPGSTQVFHGQPLVCLNVALAGSMCEMRAIVPRQTNKQTLDSPATFERIGSLGRWRGVGLDRAVAED